MFDAAVQPSAEQEEMSKSVLSDVGVKPRSPSVQAAHPNFSSQKLAPDLPLFSPIKSIIKEKGRKRQRDVIKKNQTVKTYQLLLPIPATASLCICNSASLCHLNNRNSHGLF